MLTIMSLSGALASSDITVMAEALAAYAVLVVLLIAAFCYVFGWAERKVAAKIQARHGPTNVGKYGLLQNLADAVKLLSKEHVVPRRAEKVLFLVALPLMLAITIFFILLIPFSPTLIASDIGLGALALFVVLSFAPLIAFVGGTSSGNKFAAIGAQRSAVALLGYEMPLIIVVAAVALLANSYNFVGIMGAQEASTWFVFLMPVGFVVFFVALLAVLGRPPFDLRDADSELVAGWLTDLSAPYLSLAILLDYTGVFLGSLVMAIFFFGGWSGPVLPPTAWLLIKSFVIALSLVVVRAAAHRMRTDRLLRLGWTVLLPLAILNLIITAVIFIG
jgi:NADH-quinone oxidoreductase subunit H